jgi:hypothetical protein
MGHENVLVIGNDFRGQLDVYRRTECTPGTSGRFVSVDILDEAKRRFAAGEYCHLIESNRLYNSPYSRYWRVIQNGKHDYLPIAYDKAKISDISINFLECVKKYYGSNILNEADEPALQGKDYLGWARVNADNEVIELIDRVILDGFFDWFSKTHDVWKLKPGCHGFNMDYDWEEYPSSLYAGSAKKSAIDLEGMRKSMHVAAAERWDHAFSTCKSQKWDSYKQVWKKYENQKFSMELQTAAKREWAGPPPVKAIVG